MSTAADYIQLLLDKEVYARTITYHKVLEGVPARFASVARPFPKAVTEVLSRQGVPALYLHQAQAMDAIRAGQDVVVTTPTASGKTLIYNLPFLEKRLLDPDATALYLFPLKALAQDQKKTLESLTLHWPEHARPSVALYDGDTDPAMRTRIRKHPPAVLITNPEMLHLGILPWHEHWTTFLASLSMIVLDEAHIYRGVFGAHMACLLQRLARITRRYNAHPTSVLCTATLGNPGQLGRLLLGRDTDPLVVSESGAPRGRRHMVFMDPENSAATLAISLLREALDREMRTIVYCRSRRMTELVSLWVSQQASHISRRVSAYRAGYLPEERRDIEARMASGDLLAVVSTSALEMGIDIGALDVCILVGYPGSIMSTLQRGGRVGRKGQESCVLLIGSEDALDQYFVHNPEEFFSRPAETAMLNPDNEVILARHLECAAAETPLMVTDPWYARPLVRRVAGQLAREGRLLLSDSGSEYLAARKRPQREVSLRGSGASFQIADAGRDGRIIGSVDAHQAFRETHEGAVYIHRGVSYVITRLDIPGHTAWASRRRCNWHTSVRTQKSTEIMDVSREGTVWGMPVYLGRLRVTELVTGYERRDNSSRRLLDIQPLELPPQVFETEGLWMCIPEEARVACEDSFCHFMGSIHALEHVSIGLLPLLVMADRNDFGGISIPMHPQVGGPAVFIYDGMPGGAGLCASAATRFDELLCSVEKTLLQCPCETGCPSCIQSPKCGSGNRPLDKRGSLLLVQTLARHRELGLHWKTCEHNPFAPLSSRTTAQTQDQAQEQPAAQPADMVPDTFADLADQPADSVVGAPATPGISSPETAQSAPRPEPQADKPGQTGLPEPETAHQPAPLQTSSAVPAAPGDPAPAAEPAPSARPVARTRARAGKKSARTQRNQLQGGLMRLLTPDMLAGTGLIPDAEDAEDAEDVLDDALDAPDAQGAPDTADREEEEDILSGHPQSAAQSPLDTTPGAAAVRPAAGPADSLSDRSAEQRKRRVYPGPVMFFDVETRQSAAEVGGWQNAHRMGVSIAVCWDGERYCAYTQEELGALFALWKRAGCVVGFNSSRFDMKVLQPFAPYALHTLPQLDMLTEVYRYLHYRVSLDNLGSATLGTGKSGDGLKALRWWKEGRLEEIRSYCQRDVEITRRLFEYGQAHGYVLFASKSGQKVRVPVSW